jgi:hypothetical protein
LCFYETFPQYLLGVQFVVRTDHAALQWLRRTPEPIGQQSRWLEVLEEFNFSVEHRPGTSMEMPMRCLVDPVGNVASAEPKTPGKTISQFEQSPWMGIPPATGPPKHLQTPKLATQI